MKQNIFLIILFGVFNNVGISQNFEQNSVNHVSIDSNSLYGKTYSHSVCGNILFKDEMKKINDYISEHPEYVKKTRSLQKPQSYNVGDIKNWWVQTDPDLQGISFHELASTCKAVGDNCYIFVSDESWNGAKVTQEQIEELVDSFDNTTPNFSDKGIYDVDVETFGVPPDIDGDEKIVIFLYDIEDDFATTGQANIGYFWSKDQFDDGDPALAYDRGNDPIRSNEAEIFYIDTYPLLDEDIFGIDQAKSTLAHEFQHMIHYEHDADEETFTNEGCSEIAEYVCGYGLRPNSSYAKNTNVNFLSWGLTESVIDDYSRAANWTLYLYEQYPDGILKDLVNRTHEVIGNFNGTFNNYTPIRDGWGVFEDFLIANYLNDKSFNDKYGYDYTPLTKPAPHFTHIGNMNVGETTVSINNLGAQYIEFSNGNELTVNFTNTFGILRIRAIKTGNLEPVIEEIPIENNMAEYTPTGYGTTYDKVALLIYNKSDVGVPESYTYSATGTTEAGSIELAYEDGVPDGYAPPGTWANPGDSAAVKFDGITGGKIDSIRIAFRRNGTIQLDISEFDGSSFIRGNNLYGPTQVNSPDSTTSVPYPVPYDNWVTVNLTGANIDATNDFVVSLLLGNNTSAPGIMVSAESISGHSFWYATTDNSWHTYTAEGGKIWNYVIRAYVSIGGTTVLTQPTITSIVANKGYIKLSWNSSAGPVEGYNIYRSTTTGFAPDTNNMIGIVGNTVTNYTDALPNIQANTDYFYRISSFDGDGNESDFSEEVTIKTLNVNEIHGIPTEYSLESNYPNPFNPSTTFRFITPKDGLIKFTVHDILGRVVYSENRNLFAGNYSFTWDGQNKLNQQVVSGVYFLRMEAEGFSQTRKMLLMK